MATSFTSRHISPSQTEITQMLKFLSLGSLDELTKLTVPQSIAIKKEVKLPSSPELNPGIEESEVLRELKAIMSKNEVRRSLIGMGYYGTQTPPVILRNILENPGWYTQYTPYQAEIAQGRLEALLNFQTMVSELTGLDIANASLLDEGTAAAEAVMLAYRYKGNDKKNLLVVDEACHPQTIAVVQSRSEPLGIKVIISKIAASLPVECFCALVQYPNTNGEISDFSNLAKETKRVDALLIAATDLLALTLLKPPGEWGADVAFGNTQRFGVPLGFGGPHAAFFAVKDELKRQMPGRLIGVSRDRFGKPGLRLSLQTREQHIRRDKATSNVCTAQVLLAVMASMYACYHGPKGLVEIAKRVNRHARDLASSLKSGGVDVTTTSFFDTVRIKLSPEKGKKLIADLKCYNLRTYEDGTFGISLDELTTEAEITNLCAAFGVSYQRNQLDNSLPSSLKRTSTFLQHASFNKFHSEHELLRYIHRLQSKDLSLTTSMIPLGSCTMKLNASVEMIPVTWAESANVHPFAPANQVTGFKELAFQLEGMLAAITGFDGVSLQPNSGAQGEYAGLMVVRAYHESRNEGHRDICLIPQSAHGTNPASAVMAGYKVISVDCDESGNIDLKDFKTKSEQYAKTLAAVMITYPSTHGVFEATVSEICRITHAAGGQVYMDGANMNAQVGLCKPGEFGADVCHLNLHKTFCIPHGGGGPGIGPVCCAAHLSPFLPGHPLADAIKVGGINAIGPVSAAPLGSAGILCIPWIYIRLMGSDGLKLATQVAILNANYISARLEPHFKTLYRGENGFVAHECILDLRELKKSVGIDVTDVAKRLMDYGFHAPTVSWPVVETLMIEPTESESKAELDRFCDALIAIREEIRSVEKGLLPKDDNPLVFAPHTAEEVTRSEWTHRYSREQAAYPLPYLREHKFWPSVARIDAVYGDRNLFCACS